MRFLCTLLLGAMQCFAQPNVHIRGHFEGFPSSKYQISIKLSNSFYSSSSIAKGYTDNHGNFETDIRLETPQKVSIDCLGYRVDFILSPNDTLVFCNPSRMQSPQVQGRTAALHQFLYESMLLGKDSLADKPLVRHMSLDNYSTIINDLADQYWERFQRTCDTSHSFMNTYVMASIEGQKFIRKQAHLRSQGELYINEKPPFKLLSDDARISDSYISSVQQHFLGTSLDMGMVRGTFVIPDSTQWEKAYNTLSEGLQHLPHTRELTLAQLTHRSLFTRGGIGPNGRTKNFQGLFERFQRDFPNSTYLEAINEAIISTDIRFKPIEKPKN